jgi:hypothetical protein
MQQSQQIANQGMQAINDSAKEAEDFQKKMRLIDLETDAKIKGQRADDAIAKHRLDHSAYDRGILNSRNQTIDMANEAARKANEAARK